MVDTILNRQSSIPSEFDEQYGAPSDGLGARQEVAPFRNVGQRQVRQTIMYSSTIWVTNQAQKLIGASSRRVYLCIQNLGPNSVYLGFGNVPSLGGNNALVIPSGEGFVFEDGICPNNEVFCLSPAVTQLTIIEGLDATPSKQNAG